jgi:hypothetical protein
MTALLHAHSGLRYVVLLLAVAALAVLVRGLVTKSTPGKLERALGAAFAGTLHLQVLLGFGLVVMGRFYPQLIGHLTMMIAAAVLAQTMLSMNRRRPQPGHLMPLIGVGGALLLILGGILAIGRSPLAMTVGAS